MGDPSILLIHPPAAKPSEPPAGVARLAGALKFHGIGHRVIDANIEGLYHLLRNLPATRDTWSHRAYKSLDRHLQALQSPAIYRTPDAYRRAVADINRLLSRAAQNRAVQPGLANYHDRRLAPVRSADLLAAAAHPESNPYFGFYQTRILPALDAMQATVAGISINYLSQALCAFALIGLLRRTFPALKIVIGGGLVTSWLQQSLRQDLFHGLVDRMVAGPGEAALLQIAGRPARTDPYLPDYDDLWPNAYLSPGPVLPFSASDGCWWRRCAFCPERAERRPFRPLAHGTAVRQLGELSRHIRPCLIHLLDNALSPALLKALTADPPDAPWYGFARIAAPLDDPDFCLALAASGCVMLKIGLESGDQRVLEALDKGIRLEMASRVLRNLKLAGIAAYVYLLFGTPAEDDAAALKTLAFTAAHHELIDFLNLAIFNLPLGGPEARELELRAFYPGDLALYSDFVHPRGWDRGVVRQFIEKRFRKHPAIQPILRRDPHIFTSNHAAFFTPMLQCGELPRPHRDGNSR
jgi:Radical SAM superfamily